MHGGAGAADSCCCWLHVVRRTAKQLPAPSRLRALPPLSRADQERQEARRALLAKETRLLQTIDRLKLAAAPLARAQRAQQQLAAAAAPKRWQLGDGRCLEVATPATLRAGELAAVHAALVASDGSSVDARLSALLAAKYHAKAVDCRWAGGRAGGRRMASGMGFACGCAWIALPGELCSSLPPARCAA